MSSSDARCPQCGALLRDRQQWCLLCHADLRPAAPPAAEPEPALVQALLDAASPSGEVVADPVAVPAPGGATVDVDALLAGLAGESSAPRRRGKHARVSPEEAAAQDPALALDDQTELMFALLRAESRDPTLARFGGRLDSPTARFGLMVGGATVLALGLFALFSLLGLVLG